MEVIRKACMISRMRICGFALSCVTVLFGAIALFSNHWAERADTQTGFISMCNSGICVSVYSTMPENFKTAYVFGVILLIYMPLMLVVVAAVLQGVTILKGPTKRLDLSGSICAWISTYHGLFLMIMLIAAAQLSSANESQEEGFDDTATFTESQGMAAGGYGNESSMFFGWSAYVGLIALMFGLTSAILGSVYGGMEEKLQNDDNIPLESDYA